MFTGIVQGRAQLQHAVRHPGLYSYRFEFPHLPDALKVGDSIAINGACLTVTGIEGNVATFDLMSETLQVTTLGNLAIGDRVNYEHAARFGDPIGGHAVSGHIHTRGRLVERHETENNVQLQFEVSQSFRKYLFDKGYIAVAGASLTIGAVTPDGFVVNLIPETLRLTIFNELKVDAEVNLEFDTQTQTLVDTLERIVPEWLSRHLGRST